MLPYIENIFQTVTGKSSFSDVSEDALKQIADKHPYFGAAQFLLAKKLYQQKSNNSEAAIQKAALHFTDVLWLHYNLLEEEIAANELSTINIEEGIAAPDKAPDINEEEAAANKLSTIHTEEEITATDKTSDINEEEAAANNKAPTVQEILAEAEIILKEEEENALKEHAHTNDVIEEETEPDEEAAIENLPEAISENEHTELLDEPETERNEKLSNLLKEQAAAFEKPVEETALPIGTTPAHRIDYFESQGIKLEEDKANDKLGTQLKRFTDWLKQMKKINPDNLETDVAGESQVQNMAEHSNEPKDVVTEAMAEVLIKQGKPEQAIQIYEKLSFFNPSKSAYFAAKIQELKA